MTYPNWFEVTARDHFMKYLEEFADLDNLLFLQLGAYTGDASVWMAKHILTGKDSGLWDVDTWQGSDEADHKDLDFDDVYKIYLDKTSAYKNIGHSKSTTVDFLQWGKSRDYQYNFIYVDADHTTVGVLLDAELSWPLLKSGGIMAFDDYTWEHETGDPRLQPQVGIDLFLHRHQGDYELLEKTNQVWIKKR